VAGLPPVLLWFSSTPLCVDAMGPGLRRRGLKGPACERERMKRLPLPSLPLPNEATASTSATAAAKGPILRRRGLRRVKPAALGPNVSRFPHSGLFSSHGQCAPALCLEAQTSTAISVTVATVAVFEIGVVVGTVSQSTLGAGPPSNPRRHRNNPGEVGQGRSRSSVPNQRA
jgi:hypothetical protein